jgi:hypothetical protein
LHFLMSEDWTSDIFEVAIQNGLHHKNYLILNACAIYSYP